MDPANLRYFASTCATEDLVGLLKEFGDNKDIFGRDYINSIIEGVAEDTDTTNGFYVRTQEKKSLIADYYARRGAFADKGEISADATRQVQEALIAILENMRDLTQKVGAQETNDLETAVRDLTKAVGDLGAELQAVKKTVQDIQKNGVKAKPSPWIGPR